MRRPSRDRNAAAGPNALFDFSAKGFMAEIIPFPPAEWKRRVGQVIETSEQPLFRNSLQLRLHKQKLDVRLCPFRCRHCRSFLSLITFHSAHARLFHLARTVPAQILIFISRFLRELVRHFKPQDQAISRTGRLRQNTRRQLQLVTNAHNIRAPSGSRVQKTFLLPSLKTRE